MRRPTIGLLRQTPEAYGLHDGLFRVCHTDRHRDRVLRRLLVDPPPATRSDGGDVLPAADGGDVAAGGGRVVVVRRLPAVQRGERAGGELLPAVRVEHPAVAAALPAAVARAPHEPGDAL